MIVLPKFEERSSILSVAEAIGLMISFGSLIATLIFGILNEVKKDKKNNRHLNFSEFTVIF